MPASPTQTGLHRAVMACLICFLTLGISAPSVAKSKSRKVNALETSTGPSYVHNARAMTLADEISAKHQLDRAWVRKQVGAARMNRKVLRLVAPPKQGFVKNWAVYRSRFVEQRRIESGLRFWQENERWLNKAEQDYGVPAWLIVGIVGIETIYGNDTGQFLVRDALTTLALDFPNIHPKAEKRQAYFQQELGEFLALGATGKLDVSRARGSYAGAMGWPQFMPSSWRQYAVDFDADGKTDLLTSPADVIGSVAHYFARFGWEAGLPTHFQLHWPETIAPTLAQALLEPDIVPSFSTQQLQERGIQLEESARSFAGRLAVVELQNGGESPSHIAGTQNFYVITRYNWSAYYAMAVIELGQSIAKLRQSVTAIPSNSGGSELVRQ